MKDKLPAEHSAISALRRKALKEDNTDVVTPDVAQAQADRTEKTIRGLIQDHELLKNVPALVAPIIENVVLAFNHREDVLYPKIVKKPGVIKVDNFYAFRNRISQNVERHEATDGTTYVGGYAIKKNATDIQSKAEQLICAIGRQMTASVKQVFGKNYNIQVIDDKTVPAEVATLVGFAFTNKQTNVVHDRAILFLYMPKDGLVAMITCQYQPGMTLKDMAEDVIS